MLSTIKFWVHKVRNWSLLPRIFISPCIYATAVQKTNWLTIHPRVTVSWYIHCTLIHNIYDKEFLPGCSMLSYWQGAMNGLEDWVHRCPFTVVSHQKWPQYDSERNLIVSKKERWAYSHRVLHFHFCPLLSNWSLLLGKQARSHEQQTSVIWSPAQQMKPAGLLPMQKLNQCYTRTSHLLNHLDAKHFTLWPTWETKDQMLALLQQPFLCWSRMSYKLTNKPQLLKKTKQHL